VVGIFDAGEERECRAKITLSVPNLGGWAAIAMKVERKDSLFEVTVSRDELKAIVACMNEALEIVEPFEFQTRTGFERAGSGCLNSFALAISGFLPGFLGWCFGGAT